MEKVYCFKATERDIDVLLGLLYNVRFGDGPRSDTAIALIESFEDAIGCEGTYDTMRAYINDADDFGLEFIDE